MMSMFVKTHDSWMIYFHIELTRIIFFVCQSRNFAFWREANASITNKYVVGWGMLLWYAGVSCGVLRSVIWGPMSFSGTLNFKLKFSKIFSFVKAIRMFGLDVFASSYFSESVRSYWSEKTHQCDKIYINKYAANEMFWCDAKWTTMVRYVAICGC